MKGSIYFNPAAFQKNSVFELIREAAADTNAASRLVVLRHWLPAIKL